jgi:hypothetical protein
MNNLDTSYWDSDKWLQEIKILPNCFPYIPSKLLNEKICYEAVQSYKDALYHIQQKRPDLIYEEICRLAIEFNGYSLEFVPEKYHSEQIYYNAIKGINGSVHCARFIPFQKLSEEEIIGILNMNPFCFIYIPEDKLSENLICVLLMKGLNCFEIPENFKTSKVLDLMNNFE